MGLILRVDGDRWRSHLKDVAARNPGLAPVCKGNGYGFGLHRLARKSGWLGVDTLCVGMYEELPEVLSRFEGSVMVLTPWRPFNPAVDDPRVIHTVGRLEDLRALVAQGRESGRAPRVVLERMTSMMRHGFDAAGIAEAGRIARAGGVRVEGAALHLPLAQKAATTRTHPTRAQVARAHAASSLAEVERLMVDVAAAQLDGLGYAEAMTVWVSHLTEEDLEILALKFPAYTFRPRIGTGLWLGDRSALSVTSTVLEAHAVDRGDVYGYRGRTTPRSGTLLVVSGGTAHGIGLEAPTGDVTLKARAASIARGGLDAAGFVRSPFTVGGKQRLFAEPPHMQASMLFIPTGAPVPEVGEEIGVRVRYTATAFDSVEIS